MAIKKKSNEKKRCPFVDGDCLKGGCQIYHEEFDRCMIDLLTFNIYSLAAELKKNPQK